MKVSTIVRVFRLLSEALMQYQGGAPLRLLTHRWPGLMPRVVLVTRKLASLVQVRRCPPFKRRHRRVCSRWAHLWACGCTRGPPCRRGTPSAAVTPDAGPRARH